MYALAATAVRILINGVFEGALPLRRNVNSLNPRIMSQSSLFLFVREETDREEEKESGRLREKKRERE